MKRVVQRMVVCALCVAMLFTGVPFMAMGDEGGQGGSFGVQEVSAASNKVNPGHTEKEIQDYIRKYKVSLMRYHTYATEPVPPNKPGNLSVASKQDALHTLNAIRYAAGLGEVTLDDELGDLQQHAAFVNWGIGFLSHHPIEEGYTKPSGMSDAVWQKGAEGAGQANLAFGYSTLNYAVACWMSDADAGSVVQIGHRRWMLNPIMGKTGFGAAGAFYSMNSFDYSNTGAAATENVAWPAQYTPVQFFNIHGGWGMTDAWSLSTGAQETKNKINITLTCTAGSKKGKTWTFNGATNYKPSNTGKYMNVDNLGYGQSGCIIFRPDGVTEYKPGDTYKVTITGTTKGTISYTVKFINGFLVASVTMKKSAVLEPKETLALKATISPGEALPYAKSKWQSSNAAVAKVDSTGKVTAVANGTAKITCTVDGVTATCDITVAKRIPLSDANITTTVGSVTYNGKAQKPKMVVKNKATGEVYVEGVDYKAQYYDESKGAWVSSPVQVDAGKGSVRPSATGCTGKLKGERGSTSYSVKAKAITADMVSLTYKNSKPAVTVKNGSLTMVEGRDYTLTLANGSPAGTTKATIKATNGNYTGTVTKNYEHDLKDFFKIKSQWVSKHEKTYVTFNWSGTPNNNLATQWEYAYRTKAIGTENAWSSWTKKKVDGEVLNARLYLKPNYTIEFKVRHTDEAGYCRSIFTTPAGGKYQSIKQCRVKVVTTAGGSYYRQGTKTLALETGLNFSGDTGNIIYIKKGTSIKITPNHVYPRYQFDRYPRLYPNHAWYDVVDSSKVSLTGRNSTSGMKDGAVTIKGLAAGRTTIKITSCNGRGATLTIVVK